MATPILEVRDLVKTYTQGVFTKQETFRLEAAFSVAEPAVVGVMGPNGSGKTTMFELMTGSNRPTAGEVRVMGRNIHEVKYRERDRLAIHYHQSYQVRHFSKLKPSFLMQSAQSDYPIVHLFDEPQFNTQDGYIGFMLDFFAKLRADGRVVFLCLHPNEPFHLEIMQDICERYIFVQKGQLVLARDFTTLLEQEPVQDYLGELLPAAA
ncbi:MAG: ATP-binding cassette domain-containing protein [Hyphomicrobiaceae bacterium]